MIEERALLDEGSFMSVRHLVLRGANAEIGKQLAHIAATRHGLTAGQLQTTDPGQACGQAQYIIEHAPMLWKRALGAAKAMGLDPETCDATSLPYNQLPPGLVGAGCSLVYYPPRAAESGHPTLSRNYDFPKITAAEMLGLDLPADVRFALRPFMADPYLLELHPTDGGFSSLAMVSFDLLSGVLDGVNSEGLVVAVNGDEVALREGARITPNGIGFHELACMRAVLDTCSTAAQARHLLKRARHYVAMMPCHYLVADRSGAAFVFELDVAGRPRFVEIGEDPVVVTNHPLHRFPDRSTFPAPRDVLATGTTSFDRFVHLEDAVAETSGAHDIDAMACACAAVSVTHVLEWIPDPARCQIAASPGLARTLWHALYDADAQSVLLRFYIGEDPRSDGTFVERYSDPVLIGLSR